MRNGGRGDQGIPLDAAKTVNPMHARALLALPLILVAAAIAPRASAADAGVAALQVGLHSHGLYQGPIDGISGPKTAKAIRRLQKRAHITVDGVVGPQTRKALGRFARHRLGTRRLEIGKAGWDVASLQFRLAAHGFPSGTFDGIFGPRIDAALRRFQDWSALRTDGVAGSATLAALAAPPPEIPLPLAWPMTVPVLGDRFGPRGDRWHSGIDLPAPMGTPVYAARSGQVVWAGWRDGGWGFLVVVAHGHGERSMYAHLSRIDVRLGVWVGQGVRVGLIGASGDATGPHLHFEVRIRGASVDPLRALPLGELH
ncbi:MAG TPA: peptidoglycan-binding protein [Gaiellaceae bacterium]|jgi:murein DD-endopeptidase MepM/ murein hydrolase activator NlpD|nr:peptidoglycan-binding protein [Gaiellaceae bacterium]